MPLLGIVVVLAAAIVIGIAAFRLGMAWWKYRGKRVIACPENHEAAGVSLDVRHAAFTALRQTFRFGRKEYECLRTHRVNLMAQAEAQGQ